MSLLVNFGLPFERAELVAFGPSGELVAIRYDMSNSTLTAANYEPIYGALARAELLDVAPPVKLYAVTPEPATAWLVLLSMILALKLRPWWQ